MLDQEDRNYLVGRGYTDEQIALEHIESIPGSLTFQHENVIIRPDKPLVLFYVYSMSGRLAAIQTACRLERYYHYHQIKDIPFVPILYGDPTDYDRLYETGKMILAEGLFDRVAVKRALPEYPVFARLSKGAANQHAVFVKRYVKHLWTAFDQDEAGRTATDKTNKHFAEGIEVTELKLGRFKDPGESFQKNDFPKLRDLLRRQLEATDF